MQSVLSHVRREPVLRISLSKVSEIVSKTCNSVGFSIKSNQGCSEFVSRHFFRCTHSTHVYKRNWNTTLMNGRCSLVKIAFNCGAIWWNTLDFERVFLDRFQR